ncbi:2498_t:CDS:2, partial [Funneliformis caledonium]
MSGGNTSRSNSLPQYNNTTSPLFELMNIPNRLVIEKVYLNGLHSLRRFEVRNISQSTILVKLRSNLGSQIAFQLTNENLPDLTSKKAEMVASSELGSTSISEGNSSILYNVSLDNSLINIATNTVAAAAVGAFGDSVNGHEFNQLFNYVNHIDEVIISPGSSQKVILAFLPDAHHKNRRSVEDLNKPSSIPDETDETRINTNIFTQSSEDEETHDFFEVNGLLFFFAYVIEKQQNVESMEISNFPKANVTGTYKKKSSAFLVSTYETDQVNKTFKSEIDNVPRDIETMGSSSKADYQITVKFRSTVCRSVLWTDVGETGINFDDCVNGGTYFKDFTIWNRSEIELYWLLNTVDLSNSEREDWLKFTDYDTGELLDDKPIPSYSHRRIRVTFKPKEIGEFSYDLQLENANDSANTLQSRINAVVRSVLREESLVVSSGNILDFGDCCAGVWSKQQLILKNVSEVPLEIHFSAENAEVLFHLKTDNLIENSKVDLKGNDRYAGDITFLRHRHKDVSNVTITNTPINTNATDEVSVSGSIIGLQSPSPVERLSYINESQSSRSVNKLRFNNIGGSDIERDNISGRIKNTLERENLEKEMSDGITQIEEVIFGPGREKTVQVSYRPEKDSSANDFKAGQLTRRNFRIILQYMSVNSSSTSMRSGGHERKIIQCRARSCTSFIEVNPKEVNFGDTDVGTLKSVPIVITNLSELTARVELQFVSKVLNCTHDEIVIPPKLSTKVKLDMYPRKVNVDYRKQITVVNLQNRDNDQIIEVRSTNIDKNGVTFHSLFYRILTSTGSNFIDFGPTVINSPSIRTFTIDNFSSKNLTLEITSSLSEEIVMYQKRMKIDDAISSGDQNLVSQSTGVHITDSGDNEQSSSSKLERREKLLETIGNKRILRKQPSIDINKTNLNASNLSTASSTMSNEDNQKSLANKRYSSSVLSDSASSDSSLSSAAYLDLASPSSLRSPRKRPLKIALNKMSGFAKIGRVKESLEPGSTSNTGTLKNTTGIFKRVIDSGESNMNDSSREKSQKNQNSSSINISVRNEKAKIHNKETLSSMPIESLIAILENNNNGNSQLLFPKASAEVSYVRQQMALLRELQNRMRDHQVVPIKTIEIPPKGERQIIVVFTPKRHLRRMIQGLPKKCDARVFIRLIDFDREIQQPQFEALLQGDQSHIPVRELMVNTTMCRSIMDLGQKNINFGIMDKNERRSKKILIQNRSEVPLLYNIRKSGLISSGDIMFSAGHMGVVRGYGKKEVEFTFNPSLPGQFLEKLEIENIQDRDNDQVLSVKAIIKKQSNFLIHPLNLNFEPCFINDNAPRVQHITISNTNKLSRMFEVHIDPQDLKFKWCYGELSFVLQEDTDGSSINGGLLSKETEEEIENLEQKVKIAKRKGREEKVKKLEKKLAKLRRGDTGKDDDDDIHSDGQRTPLEDSYVNGTNSERLMLSRPALTVEKNSDQSNKRPLISPNLINGKEGPKYKKTQTSIIFPMEPRTSKTIYIYFKAVAINTDSLQIEGENARPSQENIVSRIYVHEHKNTDITKTVVFKATVFYDYSSYIQTSSDETFSNEYKSESSLSSPAPESSSVVSDTVENIKFFTPSSLRKLSYLIGSQSQKGSDITPKSVDKSPIIELTQFGFPRSESPEHVEHVPVTDHLNLEPAILDIGRLEVNQRHNYYFKLSNRGDHSLNFEIIVSEDDKSFFQISQIHGTLSSQETRRIDFSVVATVVGRQNHKLLVRNNATKVECTFALRGYVHYSQYLRFPSLADDGQSELNLGYCYVDPGRKYSQVTPLIVENISDDDVYITGQSNLSLQVSVFLDENGTRGQVSKTLLKKKSVTTVWIALHPNLLSVVPATGRRNVNTGNTPVGSVNGTNISNGECRELIGGIKFIVHVKESISSSFTRKVDNDIDESGESNDTELIEAITQTVKFVSLIGRSILSVSEKLISLGSTTSIGETFYGSFIVRNMSSRLPLDYAVECPNGTILLDRTCGTLVGWESKFKQCQEDIDTTSTRDSNLVDKSMALINFRVTTSKYGLFRDKIIVTNKNNVVQIVEVEVRLFVDNNSLDFSTKDDSSISKNIFSEKAPMGLKNLKDFGKLPLLSWENVPTTIVVGSESKMINSNLESKLDLKAVIQKGYQATAVPLYEHCVEICNKSSTDIMQISPRSDLDVKIRWGPFGNTRIIEDYNEKLDVVDSPFHICGPFIELKPGKKAHLYISCPQPNSLTSEELKFIEVGKKVSIQGVLLLNDDIQKLSVKLIDLNAKFCVPKGELNTSVINLGKLGHSNSWAGSEFQFILRNLSEIPLHYELQSPDCIEILGVMDDGSNVQNKGVIASKRTVEPLIDQIITAVLKPRRIKNFSAGERTFSVNVLNMYNPYNIMTLNIQATLTLFELKFDRLIKGELVLPSLYHPLPRSDFACDAWFTIHNISEKDIRFEIGVELAPYISNFIKIDILSRFSNSPLIGSVSISAHGSIEVRVRAYPIETSRIPRESSYLINPDGVTFGKLWVATKQSYEDDILQRVAENIPIRGVITESPTFSVSTKKIRFKTELCSSDGEITNDVSNSKRKSSLTQRRKLSPSNQDEQLIEASNDFEDVLPQRESIIIKNLSEKIPLSFKVHIEGPMELSAKEIINVFPIDDNGCGTIEPGKSFNLEIELVDSTIAVSEDIKICIIDLNSLSSHDKIVLVGIESVAREPRIVEEIPDSVPEKSMEIGHKNLIVSQERQYSYQDISSDLPFITLRGCKRIGEAVKIGGCYELSLGQQDLGLTSIVKKLTLENTTSKRVSYRIKTVSASDKSWLNISRTEGTLEAPTDRQYTDAHTITLSFMTSMRNVYSTYLIIENLNNPSDTKTIRVMMEVVARQNLRRGANTPVASNHVFDIYVNGVDTSQTRIEMLNLFYGSEYSSRSMVIYNRETVPLEFSFQTNLDYDDPTEILFSTSRMSVKLFKTLTVEPGSNVRVYIRLKPLPSREIQEFLDGGNQRDPNLVEEKVIEIYVNCRLVKDYQQTLILKAECKIWRRDPNNKEDDEWNLQFNPEFREIKINNLLDKPLEYEIINDTMYFNLELCNDVKEVAPKSFHNVLVRPNLKSLIKNAESVRR